MKQIYDNLWQSERYSSGILNTHAYFLLHEQGNILFYNTGSTTDLDQMDGLGGINYQFLTHRDEVGASLATIKNRFYAKLGVGELEVPFVEPITSVDFPFKAADRTIENIKVIHTPGHTDGSICYYYDPPNGRSYLFTGDTFFLSNGHWSTLVLSNSGGTKESLASSLEILGDLRPDVVMSSGFVGETSYKEVTHTEWASAINNAIAKLRK